MLGSKKKKKERKRERERERIKKKNSYFTVLPRGFITLGPNKTFTV